MHKNFLTITSVAAMLVACVPNTDQTRPVYVGEPSAAEVSTLETSGRFLSLDERRRITQYEQDLREDQFGYFGFTASQSKGAVIGLDFYGNTGLGAVVQRNSFVSNFGESAASIKPFGTETSKVFEFFETAGVSDTYGVGYSRQGHLSTWSGNGNSMQTLRSDTNTFGYSPLITVKPLESSNTIASLTVGSGIEFWNVTNGQLTSRRNLPANVRAFAPTGNGVGVFYGDNLGRVFNSGGQQILQHPGPVADLSYDPVSGLLISGGKDGSIFVYSPSSGVTISTAKLRHQIREIVPIEGSSSLMLVRAALGSPAFVDLNTGRIVVGNFSRVARPIRAVYASPDGQFAFTLHTTREVRMWRLRDGHYYKRLRPKNGGSPTAIGVNKTTGYLAMASNTGEIELWNANTGLYVDTIYRSNNPIYRMTVGEIEPRIVFVSEDNVVRNIDILAEFDQPLSFE